MKRTNLFGSVVKSALILLICLIGSRGLAADTTGVTDTEIRIGIFGTITGPASIWGIPNYHPIIVTINEINEAGGVHGRKIKYYLEDDGAAPEKAKAAVKKLIYQNEVFALMGGTASLATYAAKMDIEKAKVPWLGCPAVMDKIWVPTFPTTFTYGITGSLDGKSATRFLLTKPDIKKVAFVYHFDDYAKSLLEAGLEELKSTHPKVESRTEVVDRGITDATPSILKIKEYKVDGVIGILYPAESAVFIRDAYKLGLTVPMVFVTTCNDLTDQRTRCGIPEAMKWVFANTYGYASILDPQFNDLVVRLKRYFPNDKPQASNFLGFAGGKILVEALKRAGRDLTREKFVRALESLESFDTKVLASKITFSKDNHLGQSTLNIVTLKKDGSEYYLPKPIWDSGILKKKNWE
jgi:branched-chain amino acid transport system substrate-binding protein